MAKDLVFSFGDSPELADVLAALVIGGRKTATCSAAVHGAMTEVGQRSTVLDGSSNPVAVIETVSYEKVRFDKVTEEQAALEGEDDLSLAAWRSEHEAYFRREGTFSSDMELYFEVFRLVEVLDSQFAERAETIVRAEIEKARANN